MPLGAEKAEHRGQRRQADRAFAQPGDVQPVLVELEPRRQQIGDRLMQARDEHAADSGFTHDFAAWYTSSVGLGVSAAILAGGRARRLGGADKASLPVGGARIIDRQLAALSAVADDVRIVANDRGRYAGLGVRVIADAVPERGRSAASIRRCSTRPTTGVLVLACDLPFVTAALLAAPRRGERDRPGD